MCTDRKELNLWKGLHYGMYFATCFWIGLYVLAKLVEGNWLRG